MKIVNIFPFSLSIFDVSKLFDKNHLVEQQFVIFLSIFEKSLQKTKYFPILSGMDCIVMIVVVTSVVLAYGIARNSVAIKRLYLGPLKFR